MKYFVFVFLLLNSLWSFSQELRTNISGLVSDLYFFESERFFSYGNIDYKPKMSFSIEVSWNFRKKHIPIRTDLSYLKIISKHNLQDDNDNWLFNNTSLWSSSTTATPFIGWVEEDITLRLDYIFLSSLYQFDLNNHWYLSIGPQLGFLIAANKTTHPDAPSRWKESNIDNKLDFGLKIGFEKFISEKLSLISNFYNGLGKVTSYGLIDNRFYARNRYFSLGISYLITHL